MQLKLLKFGGFDFELRRVQNIIAEYFQFFLNVSLPLVFCTAQKTILANITQNERRNHA